MNNHYDDVDDAIRYMREFAEDKKEMGESEDSIIASFGDIEVEAIESKDSYTVKMDKLFHSKEYGTGVKLIQLESTTGDLDVEFK